MKCLYCDQQTRVTNSRATGRQVWRRRQCPADHLYTTYERPELSQLMVEKRSGGKQPFSQSKLLLSLLACDMKPGEAESLSKTIVDQLISSDPEPFFEEGAITTENLAKLVVAALDRYSEEYGARYRSYSGLLS